MQLGGIPARDDELPSSPTVADQRRTLTGFPNGLRVFCTAHQNVAARIVWRTIPVRGPRQPSEKIQRVAPPGSTVWSAVAVRALSRYTDHGGGPADGAL